jgi:hypothetical protein
MICALPPQTASENSKSWGEKKREKEKTRAETKIPSSRPVLTQVKRHFKETRRTSQG